MLMFYSRKIFDLIDSFLVINRKIENVCLKHDVGTYSYEFITHFVRGVFDTDGHADTYRVRVKTISKVLMEQISNILFKLFIDHKLVKIHDSRPNCRDCYEITVRKKELEDFYQMIGFSNPRKAKVLRNAAAGIRTPITTDLQSLAG